MIWTKRRLLIAVAMSDTLTSKRFFELYERLNEDVSLNDTFVLGDLKYALPEETSQWIESMDWDVEIKRLQEKRVKVLTVLDGGYPQRLKEIYLPPIVLFYRGNLSLINQRAVAIVGSRDHSKYAKECIHELIPPIVNDGIVVVSGLARGVDTLAHEETLKTNGNTIAVIGSGLDVFYPPENANLYDMIAKRGLLLSEYPLESRPLKFHFPYRNRIIAGLSHGVCVIEAKEKSGSLITANLALSENREVFAVPGNIFSPHSKGTNSLIEAGACLVKNGDTISKNLKYFP
ncbi:MAG: DNA-protecting protein DprA [Streptococcus sp.]|jgi:DNA protecting protein dprA|nr:DNA-protecting protein DprA [Streptococcus sp.]